MILETARLILRPLAAEDAREIRPILADPELMAHWDWGAIDDPETVEDLIAAQIEAMDREDAFYWSIRRIGDPAFVGCLDVAEIDWRHRRAEVGFVLARPFWGHGYAQEGTHAVIDHMAGLGLKRLTARIHVGNTRCESLLNRLHFQEEGYLRGHVDREGERRDCKIYGLLL